jgi:hypothetical protein
LSKQKNIASKLSDEALRTGAILSTLSHELQERGVLPSRYIVVDVDSGKFVTGQSEAEAAARFKDMHPKLSGWLQRLDQCTGGSSGKRVE